MSDITTERASAKLQTEREVMIACDTLRTEIEHVMQVHGVDRPVVWIEHLTNEYNVTSTIFGVHRIAIYVHTYAAVQALESYVLVGAVLVTIK